MIPQGIDGVISAYYKVVVKNSHILPTGQWYGPSAVNYSALSCTILHYLSLFYIILHYLALTYTILHHIAP